MADPRYDLGKRDHPLAKRFSVPDLSQEVRLAYLIGRDFPDRSVDHLMNLFEGMETFE